MHPKSRRMFSSYNTLQRLTTHVPTPHFRKWDASSSGNTLSLRPSPVAWYSFLTEITTTLTRCSFSSFSFSVPMYVCIPKHCISLFWKPLLLFDEGPKRRKGEPSLWEKFVFKCHEVILAKLVDKATSDSKEKRGSSPSGSLTMQ